MGICQQVFFIFLFLNFSTKVWGKYCDGGVLCTPPKECCSQGCCYVYPPPGQRPSVSPEQNVIRWLLNEHWYFWLSAFVCLVVLSLCSLWNKRHILCSWFCWRHRAPGALSDRDSAGSCYLPPQYSRCSSFHHAPPPYTEVTSKPDMYPLVITYGDNADKGASYLMVHYFRNYIIRPSGSLSATSTADSLSSSFICNASNETNTIIPPPYSSTGNFEEWRHGTGATSSHRQALLRSFSSLTCPNQTATQHNRGVRQSASTNFKAPLDSNGRNFECSMQTTEVQSPIHIASEEEVFYSEQRINNNNSSQTIDSDTLNPPKWMPSKDSSYIDGSSERNSSQSSALHFIFNENNLTSNRVDKRLNAPPDSSMRDNQIHSNDFRKYNIQSQYWHLKDLKKYKQNDNDNISSGGGNGASRCLKMDKSMAQNVFCNDDNNSYRNKIFPNCSRSPFHRRYDLDSPIYSEEIPSNTLCQIGEDNADVDYNNYHSSIDTGNRICGNFSLHPNLEELRTSYISITGSDISSLADIGTPNSPPRATSPTSGKDTSDRIHHALIEKPSNELKIYCDYASEASSSYAEPKTNRLFGRSRNNSLYMPLSLAPNPKMFLPCKVSPTSTAATKCASHRRGRLSRSAPTTPCGNGIMPGLSTMSQRKMSTSGSSKNNQEEKNPLLAEKDNADDPQHVDF